MPKTLGSDSVLTLAAFKADIVGAVVIDTCDFTSDVFTFDPYLDELA